MITIAALLSGLALLATSPFVIAVPRKLSISNCNTDGGFHRCTSMTSAFGLNQLDEIIEIDFGPGRKFSCDLDSH